MICAVDKVATAAAQVDYQDRQLEEHCKVRCYPMDTPHGELLVLGLRDAEGKVVTALLTSQMAEAVRAALALANLPGARVATL